MNSSSSFQTIIESVESLSEEEQEILVNLIHKRRTAIRRQEIAQNAIDTMIAVNNGTVQRGTAAEIMDNIFQDEE